MTRGLKPYASVAVLIVAMAACTRGRAGDEPVPRAAERETTSEGAHDDPRALDEWFYGQRSAPASRVPAGARLAALHEARAITTDPGLARLAVASWTNLGPQPIDTSDATYDDPSLGTPVNGFHAVSGRVVALAAKPGAPNTVYAGAAMGGVWKTTDGGAHWSPIGDQLPSLAIGALAVDPAAPQTLYVGTGEPSRSGDSYFGAGLFRSIDGGATFTKIGGARFDKATIYRIRVFGSTRLLVATNRGLYRSTDGGIAWQRVLAPGGTADPYGNFVTDVVIVPKSSGSNVIAAVGWDQGDPNNGLYSSTNGGLTFTKIAPSGYPLQGDLGRTSFAVSASTGGLIYAVIQDATPVGSSSLAGIYKTTTGANGTWTMVADASTFASDPNSALSPAKGLNDYLPGVQAWYNQTIEIDPTDPNDVVVGLEEIYNTADGGATWHTIGRYWNWCSSSAPPNCLLDPDLHPTTHPDQHAFAFAKVGGNPKLFVGNDGGIWSQQGPGFDNDGWVDLNATLSITQAYYASVSSAPNPVIYAGTQDNGDVKYTGSASWPEVKGGDGGDSAVEPANPDHAYAETPFLDMYRTADGGQTWTWIAPGDADPRFVAPFDLDPANKDHLVALGRSVWESTSGISTTSGSWTQLYDMGSPRQGTALAVKGSTIYAGWCGPCNPDTLLSDTPFASGIVSNQGGTWHEAPATGLPNRYVTSITMAPTDPTHIYVTLSGFSRRWIPTAGNGHVFESTDSGATFADISANLPDAPANDTVLYKGKLFVATDVGVFKRTTLGTWASPGTGMPKVSVLDLATVPGGTTLVAATHGRGIWTLPLA